MDWVDLGVEVQEPPHPHVMGSGKAGIQSENADESSVALDRVVHGQQDQFVAKHVESGALVLPETPAGNR